MVLVVPFALLLYEISRSPSYRGVVESAGSKILIRYDEGRGLDACGGMEFEPVNEVVVERDGERIAWTDIRVGDRVNVWASNYVDDSCPGQTSAERVEVLG